MLLIQGLGGVAAGTRSKWAVARTGLSAPAAMRGCVYGTIQAGAFATMPLGVLIASVALDDIELRATILAVDACDVLTTLVPLIEPAIHEMDPTPPPASAPKGGIPSPRSRRTDRRARPRVNAAAVIPGRRDDPCDHPVQATHGHPMDRHDPPSPDYS